MFIAQWFALTGCVLATIAQKRQVLYTCAVVPLLHLAGSADRVSFLYLEMHCMHGVRRVVVLQQVLQPRSPRFPLSFFLCSELF